MPLDRFDKLLPDLEAEAAVARAAHAARKYGLTAGAFRASITAVEAAQESYERVLHRIERRLVQLKTAPGGSGTPQPYVPDPGRLDPWSVDPARIENDSRVVATCHVCNGTRRMTCENCSGRGRANCGYCGGSGRVLAQRKGQWTKSCPSCRGRGDQKCVCSNGKMVCQPCSATGTITAWLAINRSIVEHVVVHPRNAAASVHRKVNVSADFDTHQWPNRLVQDSLLPASAASIQPALAAPLDAKTDRLLDSRLQRFANSVYKIKYATALGKGTVEVVGQPADITGTTDWSPLRSRGLLAAGAGIAMLAGAGYLLYRYQAQHAWYYQHGNVVGIALLGVLAAVSTALSVGGLLMPARARSVFNTWFPLSAALAFLTGLGVAYGFQQPKIQTAEAALAAKDFPGANLVTDALEKKGEDAGTVNKMRDRIQRRQLEETEDLLACCEIARKEWKTVEARTSAVHLVSAKVSEEGTRSFKAHDTQRLERLAHAIEGLDSNLHDRLTWLAASLRAAFCLGSDDIEGSKASLTQMLKMPTPVLAESPYDLNRLAESATSLREQLDSINAAKPYERREALAKAIEKAQGLSEALGLPFDKKTHPLQKRLLAEHQPALTRKRAKTQPAVATSASAASSQGDVPSPYPL